MKKLIPFDIELAKKGMKVHRRGYEYWFVDTHPTIHGRSIFVSVLSDSACIFLNSELQMEIDYTPTLRPWKPEEVPVGALLKDTSVDFGNNPIVSIISVRGAWVGFVDHRLATLQEKTTHYLFNHPEILCSTDNGKTWSPCGVLE